MRLTGICVLRAGLALLLATGAAVAQDDAKKSLAEQAAYAADYEQDFPKALKLYDRAIAEARSKMTDDHPSVRALASARRKVADLAGDGGAAPQDPTTRPAASFARRAAELVGVAEAFMNNPASGGDVGDPNRAKAALLGGELVPYLQAMLLDGAMLEGMGGSRSVAPEVVAQLLSAIEDPRANNALGLATKSPDPVVRVAAVRSLDVRRHREWILESASAASDQIRTAAFDALARAKGDDDAAAALLKNGAREGHWRAAEWLTTRRRGDAFALLADKELPGKGRDALFLTLAKSSKPPTADELRLLVKAAETGGPDAVRVFADLLSAHVSQQTGRDAIAAARADLERWLLANLGNALTLGSSQLRDVWPAVAGLASIPALERIYNGGRFVDRSIGVGQAYEPEAQFRKTLEALMFASDFDAVALVGALATTDERFFLEANQSGPQRGQIRSAVAQMLGEMSSRASAKTMAEALAKTSGVRRQYLLDFVVMGHFESQSRAQAVDVDGTVTLALTVLRESKNDKALRRALATLETYPRAQAVEELVSFYLRTANDDLRVAAASALRPAFQSVPAECKRVVEPPMLAAEDTPEGNRALGLLFQFEDADVLRLVDALWKRPRSKERTQTLQSALVRGTKTDAGLKVVVDRWKDEPIVDADLRKSAIDRFAKSLYQPALPILREALTDSNQRVREAAQSAFKTFKENRAALEELDEWVRADAQKSDAVGELVGMLDSPKPEVVVGAVRALGALKAKTALPKLVKLLERDSADLRVAINEAIGKIGS
jgi:HEAT repeat protein